MPAERTSTSTSRVEQLSGLKHADVAGVPVAVTSLDGAVAWLQRWVADGRGGISVRLVNAYSLVEAHRNPAYLQLVRNTGVSFPDGTPVAVALRLIARQSTADRVRGPSFFLRALASMSRGDERHFFLGTSEQTLRALRTNVHSRWPSLSIVGQYAPPFSPLTDQFIEDCRRHIADTGATCVWVALGTPKQDAVAEGLAAALGVPCIAVGAAFDFLAGAKREAPKVMQVIGAEWLYRFATEPRRLWRRYLIGNLIFISLLIREGRHSRT